MHESTQSTERIVRILEHDPELGASLTGERLAQATLEVRALTRELAPGRWEERSWPAQLREGLGLLVLDGLLLRRVGLDGRFGAELLASGDLLRPWQREDAFASIAPSSGWRVLEGARVAVLDLTFARRLAPFPEIHGELLARMLRRARQLAVIMAIAHQPRVEARLLMLLWHLADRWGIVRGDGVLVPLQLTHTVLAELLASTRPTVSSALGALQRRGEVAVGEAGWTLMGRPPADLQAVVPDAQIS
jgi:CRP/FNR family transcriptional regulator, cyclic AMP receptor protein